MNVFFNNRSDTKQEVWPKLTNICYACCLTPKNIDMLKEILARDIKAKAVKLKNVYKYLPVFVFLY